MELMIESFPRLLNATLLTIKLTLLSLFFYSFAAVLYLFLTFLSMQLFNKLEKHYSREH